MRPVDRKYLKSHEWCLITDGIATVGITDYAISHLSDLVFLDLPEAGTDLNANETFGEIESVKAVSDLNSPVSGEVVEANEDLVDNLETLNGDPFGAGWMLKVKVTQESDELLDATEYEEHLKSEEA
jgi:glycine cleavage system H protein